jgi:hypothetical protein
VLTNLKKASIFWNESYFFKLPAVFDYFHGLIIDFKKPNLNPKQNMDVQIVEHNFLKYHFIMASCIFLLKSLSLVGTDTNQISHVRKPNGSKDF